jgi:hypothetical protein
MGLKEYFETKRGTGVLATADAEGVIDVALFARPHVLEEGVGFIMPDRRTHQNLGANPHAAYLFIEESAEEGKSYTGKRLTLKKKAEELDTERVRTLRRRTYDDDKRDRYLVLFDVLETRPLVGDAEAYAKEE